MTKIEPSYPIKQTLAIENSADSDEPGRVLDNVVAEGIVLLSVNLLNALRNPFKTVTRHLFVHSLL